MQSIRKHGSPDEIKKSVKLIQSALLVAMIRLVGNVELTLSKRQQKNAVIAAANMSPRNAGRVGKPAMNVENATISQLCAEAGNDKVRRPTKPA